jgi:hypothetical protein
VKTPTPWQLPTEPTTSNRLHQCGVTEAMIRTQLRAGGLIRLRQGVYLATSVWPTDRETQHVLRARAEVAANPAAVISHESAALVWGLPFPAFGTWAEALPSIIMPAGQGYRGARRGATHHVVTLPPTAVTRDKAGYSVTTIARSAVDLAMDREVPAALAVLDAAARLLCASYVANARRHDFTNPALAKAARTQLVDAAPAHRRAGLAKIVALVDPARESVAESLSAACFALAGLPTPTCQERVVTPKGTFFPDFWWREHRLIGECDGAVKYTDPTAYVHEKEREQAIRDAGYRVVRWLAKEIMASPEVVVDRVSRALRL